jgi:ribose transport system substrate-binding protein
MAAVACVSLALATTGCMGSSQPDTRAQAARDTRLGLIVPDWTSDSWDALRTGVVEKGQELSVQVLTDAADDKTNATAQERRVAPLAEEDLDCFAIAPVDAKALVQPLTAIAKKKIPIFNVGIRLDEAAAKKAGVPIASFLGPSDSEIGHQAARKMLTSVPAGSPVAMVIGTSAESDPNAEAQRKGFQEGIGSRLTVVKTSPTNDDYANAVRVVTEMVSGQANLRGIFASSDAIGRAAAKAVADLGRSGTVKIISVGGSLEGLRAVQTGELTATVATYPVATGRLLTRACRQVVDGGTIKPRLTTETRLIDQAAVAAAIGAYPEPTEQFQDPLG